MSNTLGLNFKLKAIAESTETAGATSSMLIERERNTPHADIGRVRSALVRDGARLVEADYMKFWQDLQDAGAGSIIYGRKGKPSRFAWHYSLRMIGQAMLTGKGKFEGVPKAEAQPEAVVEAPVAKTAKKKLSAGPVSIKMENDKISILLPNGKVVKVESEEDALAILKAVQGA